MKTKTINGAKFNVLKPEKFTYCNKHFTNERYLSVDKKVLITTDEGFNYVRIFTGNTDGKAIDITRNILQRDIHSYPLYCITEIDLNIIPAQNEITVHKSHFE